MYLYTHAPLQLYFRRFCALLRASPTVGTIRAVKHTEGGHLAVLIAVLEICSVQFCAVLCSSVQFYAVLLLCLVTFAILTAVLAVLAAVLAA